MRLSDMPGFDTYLAKVRAWSENFVATPGDSAGRERLRTQANDMLREVTSAWEALASTQAVPS